MAREKFSLEFKQRTIEQIGDGHHVVQVSRQHDIAVSTTNCWIKGEPQGEGHSISQLILPPRRIVV
ncbi:transposase [Pasteuria penetrans]|uniref:transposase n=1 Tax=Pasteuria penetrans TaxID=86005 RepID=UPI0011F03F06|nr:transposase [Pasteuria penetrans]